MIIRFSPRTYLIAAAWLGLLACFTWAGLTFLTRHTAARYTAAVTAPLEGAARAAELPSSDNATTGNATTGNATASNATTTIPDVVPDTLAAQANATGNNATTALPPVAAPLLDANATVPAASGILRASNATASNATTTIPDAVPDTLAAQANATTRNATESALTSLPATNSTAPAVAPQAHNATMPAELDPHWLPLIARLEADGFSPESMTRLFAALGANSYSPAFMGAKVAELRGVYGLGITPLPYEIDLTPEGYVQPLPDTTAGDYRAFLAAQAETLAAIRTQYGVSPDIIMGILLVETGMGMNIGQTSALRALGSMAATTTPTLLGSKGNAAQARRVPSPVLAGILKSKSDWAYKELKALIRYGEQYGYPSAGIPGSVYGAIGLCQFMPSNIDLFGVDGDQDGKIDLFSVTDALHSVARYLESSGWRGAHTAEKKVEVIRQYNDDGVYAQMVLAVANQVARAAAGKVKDGVNLMGAAYPMSGRYIDPSIRRFRGRVPAAARVKSLGDYSSILQGNK